MPPINRYKCNTCSFELPMGWGGIAYIESDEGERITLTHPIEDSIREKVLNIPRGTLSSFSFKQPQWWWSAKRINTYKINKEMYDLARARSGFISNCICVNCLKEQQLDLEKDERKCCSCSSMNIKSLRDLLGSVCPSCKKGIIKEIETGIWT